MVFALPCQLAAADRLAAAAGLILALRWPSGPWPSDPLAVWTWSRRTPITIGAWSLSAALVSVGAGWCEKPIDQPNDPTPDKAVGSWMKFRARRLSDYALSNIPTGGVLTCAFASARSRPQSLPSHAHNFFVEFINFLVEPRVLRYWRIAAAYLFQSFLNGEFVDFQPC